MGLFKIQIASVVSVHFLITVLASHSMDAVDRGFPDYARASAVPPELSEGTFNVGPDEPKKEGPGRRPVPRMEKMMKTFRELLVTCLLGL